MKRVAKTSCYKLNLSYCPTQYDQGSWQKSLTDFAIWGWCPCTTVNLPKKIARLLTIFSPKNSSTVIAGMSKEMMRTGAVTTSTYAEPRRVTHNNCFVRSNQFDPGLRVMEFGFVRAIDWLTDLQMDGRTDGETDGIECWFVRST